MLRRQGGVAALALWLALAGSLFNALIPLGDMPVFDHGRVALAWCPGYGPVPFARQHPGRGPHQHAVTPCPFAAAATPGMVAVAAALPILPQATSDVRAPRRLQRRLQRPRRPVARGPPPVSGLFA